jgi:hypothetical protein
MRSSGIVFSSFVAVLLLQSCAAIDDDRIARCGGAHRLQVVDLDMSPDPVGEGQRINRWLVRLRADGSGECRTVVRIRELGGDEIGRERTYRLRPGINTIEVEPNERYRFARNEHCFQVVANIAETPRPVDAARRFCAREIAGRRWSMRDR